MKTQWRQTIGLALVVLVAYGCSGISATGPGFKVPDEKVLAKWLLRCQADEMADLRNCVVAEALGYVLESSGSTARDLPLIVAVVLDYWREHRGERAADFGLSGDVGQCPGRRDWLASYYRRNAPSFTFDSYRGDPEVALALFRVAFACGGSGEGDGRELPGGLRWGAVRRFLEPAVLDLPEPGKPGEISPEQCPCISQTLAEPCRPPRACKASAELAYVWRTGGWIRAMTDPAASGTLKLEHARWHLSHPNVEDPEYSAAPTCYPELVLCVPESPEHLHEIGLRLFIARDPYVVLPPGEELAAIAVERAARSR